jgi:hypothetical protein
LPARLRAIRQHGAHLNAKGWLPGGKPAFCLCRLLQRKTMRSQAEERRMRLVIVFLHGVALALVAASLYARTLPPTPTAIPDPTSAEAAWWGLWPVTYLPTWATAVGAMLVVGLIAAWWWRDIQRGRACERSVAEGNADAARSLPAQMTGRLFAGLIILSALIVGAFYIFPLAHTRWGDAYMLAKGIAYPDPALRLTHSWQAPLDVFLHSSVWAALHGAFAWKDAVPVYRLLSPVAGALYLLVILALSRNQLLAPGWLVYGLLATLGLMQLFFGYVENYSFAAALVLCFLWISIEVLRGNRGLWLAAALLAVANATHPSTVILAPPLLYVGWHTWKYRNKKLRSVVMEIALPVLFVGSATFLWMEASGHGLYALLNTDRPGGGDASWFVPLVTTTTRWEHYTMFSWPHLRDWLNEQLLVAPVVLPGLVVAGIDYALNAARHETVLEIPASDVSTARFNRALLVFLAVSSLAFLLFTFVWNPDYGGQRDWDLFSLAWLPAALWFTALLPRILRDRHYLWGGALPLIAFQAWHTIAWIYQNTLPWQWPS